MAVETPVLIIGAGPAGLATAARLRHQRIPFVILERHTHVAEMWRRHYDRLCLHTVKELSHLPFVPFPEHYPRYVSRRQLVEYYEQYAQRFSIKPEFGKQVITAQRSAAGWRVETKDGTTYHTQHLVVATGVNRVPKIPTYPDQEIFNGTVQHSRLYRNPDPYRGQRVVVIGMGNTGAEIALDLAEHEVDVTLSVRSPTNIVPRDLLGRPTQRTALQLAKPPNALADRLSTWVPRWAMGDLRPYGIERPPEPASRQLRQTGKTPVIDLGTIDMVRRGKIRVVGGIASFLSDGILLRNGKTIPADAIIYATGYHPRLHDFLPSEAVELSAQDVPVASIYADKQLYFTGFDIYRAGGILGTVLEESERIAEHLQRHHYPTVVE